MTHCCHHLCGTIEKWQTNSLNYQYLHDLAVAKKQRINDPKPTHILRFSLNQKTPQKATKVNKMEELDEQLSEILDEQCDWWHAVDEYGNDALFCSYGEQFVQWAYPKGLINPMPTIKQRWQEKFGFKFLNQIPKGISFEQYLSTIHN